MTSTILARCHCSLFNLTLTLPELPHNTTHCHCTMCRHITGAPYASGLSIPSASSSAVVEAVTKAGLRMYVAGPKREWWFCAVCGSHVLVRVTDAMAADCGVWKVMVGAVDGVVGGEEGLRKESLERVVGHVYVGETGDGGVAVLFQGGTRQGKVEYWEGECGKREIEDLDAWIANKSEMETAVSAEAKFMEGTLQGSCHCGGVKFHLLRSDNDKAKKHRASLCMCRSCRLTLGQSLTAWAMRIPLHIVIRGDGKPLDSSLYGTLQRYKSSKHKSRDFCGTCGASVFSYDSGRVGVVDIVLGVLRSGEGVRARSWLQWDEHGIYPVGDVVDEGLRQVIDENYVRFRG